VGVGSRFHVLRSRTQFRRNRGRRFPFSCFARPDSFSAVPRVSDPILMFCTPGLVFGCTEGVRSRFHVLRARTGFRPYRGASGPVYMFCAFGLVFGGNKGVGSRFHILRARTCFLLYRGRRVPISCFLHLDSFSVVSRATGPVIMYCESGHVFNGTECVGSSFHVLRTRTRFWLYRGREFLFSYFALADSFSAIPRALGPILMYCWSGHILSGTEGVGSRFHVLHAHTHFLLY
jgi:hypothetical protein